MELNWAKLNAERAATQSLMDLYDLAKRCQDLHLAAGMPVPDPLMRLIGVNDDDSATATRSARKRNEISVTAPSFPKPEGAGNDWISIPSNKAGVSSVALALLRQNKVMRPRDLNQAVLDILPHATSGSVANMGTRLQGEMIDRTDEGWRLLDCNAAGILADGRLWWSPTSFTAQDLAAHRREAILYILSAFPTGLQTVQIVEQLKKCRWVSAPVNKDLLKADMEELQSGGKVRRRGNSKKWEAVIDAEA